MKSRISLFTILLLAQTALAQSPAMADQMRAEGKIYVVVGVVVLIFAVLFAYMIYLDVKLRKLEGEKNA